MKRVIVVGGGASGMAAAYQAGLSQCEVTLFEQNEKLGKKLYITGKGRCNLTNDSDPASMLNHVIRNPKFLYRALNQFTAEDVKSLMERFGCPVKTERGNRVFPVSDRSSDVLKAWERALALVNVQVKLRTRVTSIRVSKDRVEGIFASTDGAEPRFYGADAVIIATGGCTYPLTGSTGDGYRFLQDLGVSVRDRFPALVPLNTHETWVKDLSGLSLRNCAVRFSADQKTLYESFGELLFTHFGISGPVVLSASSRVTELLFAGKEIAVEIDLKPALSEETLDQRLIRELENNRKAKTLNALRSLLPLPLLHVVLTEAGVDPDGPAVELRKEARKRIVKTLKSLKLTAVSTRGNDEAVITDGGIEVREIDPGTMRIRKYQNLFVAGELIDVDAETGGYNLGIAWATGIMAGKHAGGETP